MTDETKKLLTEWMGECYHEWGITDDAFLVCQKCQARRYHVHENRTFTDAQDVQDLGNKLVEKGLWQEFLEFSSEIFLGVFPVHIKNGLEYYNFRFILFIMLNPTRFCELVGEFLKKEGK